MVKAPERIWVWVDTIDEMGSSVNRDKINGYVEYVRADRIEALEDRCRELLKALEWQPIETAPRVPGNRILAYCPDKGIRETFFASSKGTPSESKTDGWWQWHEPVNNWVQSWQPTHWKPLPLQPHGGGDVG